MHGDQGDANREMLAVSRGRDGQKSKRMFGPGDALPQAYVDGFRTEIYNDLVRVQGAWNKIAVVAREDDVETMLNHALLQARRRGDV